MSYLRVHTKHTPKETVDLGEYYIALDTIAEVYKIKKYRTEDNYATVDFRVKTKRGEAYEATLSLIKFKEFIEGRSR